MSHAPLKLSAVRDVFRLVGELRELGADPEQWRPHMVRRLQKLLDADLVISSEIHFRRIGRGSIALNQPQKMRVVDIGWGCGVDGDVWRIHTERDDEKPESYWLMTGQPDPAEAQAEEFPEGESELVPVKPSKPLYGGRVFILSQIALPHVGAVDQLGLHRSNHKEVFTSAQHRLARLLHVELGRLWRKDALRKVQDPTVDLPPRLAQTLGELLNGSSEKQIAMKLELSRHTIHNYVKALHQRFQVSSRGELLAKVGKEKKSDFRPKLTIEVSRNLGNRPATPDTASQ